MHKLSNMHCRGDVSACFTIIKFNSNMQTPACSFDGVVPVNWDRSNVLSHILYYLDCWAYTWVTGSGLRSFCSCFDTFLHLEILSQLKSIETTSKQLIGSVLYNEANYHSCSSLIVILKAIFSWFSKGTVRGRGPYCCTAHPVLPWWG